MRLKRKGVISEDVESYIIAANLEVAQEILFAHLMHHANVDTLMKYCEVVIGAEGYPKMQSLGRKMKEELNKVGWLVSGCVCTICDSIMVTVCSCETIFEQNDHCYNATVLNGLVVNKVITVVQPVYTMMANGWLPDWRIKQL